MTKFVNMRKLENTVFNNMGAIDNICLPLKKFGITGFFYQRLYHDGKIINLTTSNEWSISFLKNLFSSQYPPQEILDYFFIENGVSLWKLNPHNIIWQEGEKHFSFGNGISIYSNGKTYSELAGFYSTKENHNINNFYINNIDILKKFLVYFKNETFLLRRNLHKESIYLPTIYCKDQELLNLDNTTQKSFDEYLQDHKGSYSNPQGAHITKREDEIRCLVVQGRSAKQIAKLLNISNRTIETHIYNLKKKLALNKTSELIYYSLE